MSESAGRRLLSLVICALLCLSTVSCLPQKPKNGMAYDGIQQSLNDSISENRQLSQATPLSPPSAVSDAMLLPSLPVVRHSKEKRFNVTADALPAKEFFMGLVEGTQVNMVVNPDVGGKITLHLKNVTISEAIQVVHDVYGYSYRQTSMGYVIFPRKMENGFFNVNYLDVTRKGKSVTELSSGQISEKITGPTTTGNSSAPVVQTATNTNEAPAGSRVETRSEMDFWKELGGTLHSMVGSVDGRSVTVNPQAGVVMVHAYPDELAQVGRYLDRIQSHMGRQVIIEAKILEVRLNDQFQSGINWNLFGKGEPENNEGGVAQKADNPFQDTNLKNFTSIFTLNAGKGSFNAIVKLLQTQGNVQVLSSPRISTINNQKAVIKVGTDQFFVTGVSTDNTITATSTIPTQNVSLTPFFSGVNFDVTPEISGNNMITLHIHPSISKVTEQTQTIVLGQTSSNTANTLILPLALSTIRESDNIVRARNGQIVVIGGLMQDDMREEIAGIPGLSKLPFIGTLFRRTAQISEKSELVILLRPVLADNQAWDNEMRGARREFHQLKRGFHVGGLPEVFGTEGETDGS